MGRFDMPTHYEFPTHAEATEWTLPAVGEAAFTWEGCGRDTVAAYEAALA